MLLLVSLAIVVCAPQETPREHQAQTKEPSSVNSQYFPSSRVIDCMITVDGVTLAIFPDWEVHRVRKTIELVCIADPRVTLQIVVKMGKDRQSEIPATETKTEAVSGLNGDLHYSMALGVGGRTDLIGTVVLPEWRIDLQGSFFEHSSDDKRVAGELWQMVHWMSIAPETEGQ